MKPLSCLNRTPLAIEYLTLLPLNERYVCAILRAACAPAICTHQGGSPLSKPVVLRHEGAGIVEESGLG